MNRAIVAIILAAGIAQSHGVHTVDGNVVFSYKVALDHFGQTLGVLDAGCAGCRRVRFYFQDVARLATYLGRQIVESFAR